MMTEFHTSFYIFSHTVYKYFVVVVLITVRCGVMSGFVNGRIYPLAECSLHHITAFPSKEKS
jgi:hypothetical protein